MFAAAQSGAGSINARRRTGDGWQDGTTEVSVTDGELVVQLDASASLAASRFALAIDPIDIPEVVFGKPAQLRDVKLTLAAPTAAASQWSDDNDATATFALQLDLAWTLAFDTASTPLGTQHLPAVPVDVTLAGGGAHVDVTLAMHSDGELWSWADVIQLTQLQLTVSASTVD